MANRRGVVKALALGVAVSFGGLASSGALAQQKTIKVGVLHSLSGTMAISETVLKDTALMAMVPERECRMPTLMGPVSGLVVSAGAGAGAAALGAAGASFFSHPASNVRALQTIVVATALRMGSSCRTWKSSTGPMGPRAVFATMDRRLFPADFSCDKCL